MMNLVLLLSVQNSQRTQADLLFEAFVLPSECARVLVQHPVEKSKFPFFHVEGIAHLNVFPHLRGLVYQAASVCVPQFKFLQYLNFPQRQVFRKLQLYLHAYSRNWCILRQNDDAIKLSAISKQKSHEN